MRGSSFARLSFLRPKIYIPSTLNIDLILWHTQLNVCAENVKSWFKSWFKSWLNSFFFRAYTQPQTLNCICDSLFAFHIWILKQFEAVLSLPKAAGSAHTHKSTFGLFGALYMYVYLCLNLGSVGPITSTARLLSKELM